jgi:hypothetical protein
MRRSGAAGIVADPLGNCTLRRCPLVLLEDAQVGTELAGDLSHILKPSAAAQRSGEPGAAALIAPEWSPTA